MYDNKESAHLQKSAPEPDPRLEYPLPVDLTRHQALLSAKFMKWKTVSNVLPPT